MGLLKEKHDKLYAKALDYVRKGDMIELNGLIESTVHYRVSDTLYLPMLLLRNKEDLTKLSNEATDPGIKSMLKRMCNRLNVEEKQLISNESPQCYKSMK